MANWDTRFLKLAKHISTWSKDPSTKVGAVITDINNRIISVGYNGFPQGILDTTDRLNDRELKYKLTLHAEENAIAFGDFPYNGYGYYMYIWPYPPCAHCAAQIIQKKCFSIIYSPNNIPERWKESINLASQMFKEAGVTQTLV